jgi:hypothetical protein
MALLMAMFATGVLKNQIAFGQDMYANASMVMLKLMEYV